MADSDGRDETGSSSKKTRVKDSQLEDHNQQPAAINNSNESREEEEAKEHQEEEPTVQETNRASREEEGDGNRDAATGEEKEEINEGAENPLLHGETIKKRKADHEGGSGVVTLTLVGGDLPGAQTGNTAMPMMMGRLGSEVVGLGGGGVSISAAGDWRSVPKVYKCNYCAWTTRTFQAMGGHVKGHSYAVRRAFAAAFASLDNQRAAAEEDPPEADHQEPPPRPAGQDEGGRDEENQKVDAGRLDLNELPAVEAREHHQEAPPPSMTISEPEAAASFDPPVAADNDHDAGAGRRFDLNELPAVEDEDEQHADIQPADNNAAAAQPQEQEASGDDKDADRHEPAEDSPAALD
uniref:C2H2-type domain-containing protein n=1 Tax=Kalanchoe fedtschenkoi TaxID=63787 RepID=A0A7N0U2T8_KALFE